MNTELIKKIVKVMDITGKDYSELAEMSVKELNEFYEENISAYIPSVGEQDELIKIMRQYKDECDKQRTTIIITATQEDAYHFNAHCQKHNLPFYAVAKGETIRGFKDGEKRPNTVIMFCDIDLEDEFESLYIKSITDSLDSNHFLLIK